MQGEASLNEPSASGSPFHPPGVVLAPHSPASAGEAGGQRDTPRPPASGPCSTRRGSGTVAPGSACCSLVHNHHHRLLSPASPDPRINLELSLLLHPLFNQLAHHSNLVPNKAWVCCVLLSLPHPSTGLHAPHEARGWCSSLVLASQPSPSFATRHPERPASQARERSRSTPPGPRQGSPVKI